MVINDVAANEIELFSEADRNLLSYRQALDLKRGEISPTLAPMSTDGAVFQTHDVLCDGSCGGGPQLIRLNGGPNFS